MTVCNQSVWLSISLFVTWWEGRRRCKQPGAWVITLYRPLGMIKSGLQASGVASLTSSATTGAAPRVALGKANTNRSKIPIHTHLRLLTLSQLWWPPGDATLVWPGRIGNFSLFFLAVLYHRVQSSQIRGASTFFSPGSLSYVGNVRKHTWEFWREKCTVAVSSSRRARAFAVSLLRVSVLPGT